MDEDYVQVIDVGAGEASPDVAADSLEERVTVVAAEKTLRIYPPAPGPLDRLAIGDRAGRIGRPVTAIRAAPGHPDRRWALHRPAPPPTGCAPRPAVVPREHSGERRAPHLGRWCGPERSGRTRSRRDRPRRRRRG